MAPSDIYETALSENNERVLKDHPHLLATPVGKLKAALIERLHELADKADDPRGLLEMEQTARLARELLAVGSTSLDVYRGPGALTNPSFGGTSSALSGMFPGTGLGIGGLNLETFGAMLIKEAMAILPMFKKKGPSLAVLMDALESAKAQKDEKLVARLTKKVNALLSEDEEDVNAHEEEDEPLPEPPVEVPSSAPNKAPRVARCGRPHGHRGPHVPIPKRLSDVPRCDELLEEPAAARVEESVS